jgi:hypothetical protein
MKAGRLAVCLTGMHRSGTSLTASWLEACGLPMSLRATHGPAVGNVKGHFEDRDFADLHNRALRRRFPTSAGWKVKRPGQLSFEPSEVETARRLIQERNGQFDQWGWKDPRSVLFLDEWKSMVPELRVMMVWRQCDEVIHSLIKRSWRSKARVMKVSALDTVRLWLTYNQMVCDFVDRHPDRALLLPLPMILKNDAEAFDRIVEELQIDLKYTPVSTVLDTSLLNTDRKPPLSTLLRKILGGREVAEMEERLSGLSVARESLDSRAS